MDPTAVTVPLPAGPTVVVLGPASATLIRALWQTGLRPVRGQRSGTVWVLPEGRSLR